MSSQDNHDKTEGKITLSLDVADVISKVSQSKAGPISGPDDHFREAEAIKKAWYDLLYKSVEKLDIRLDKFRDELKVEITRVDTKAEKLESDIVIPLQTKFVELKTKIGVWASIAGVVGSLVFSGLGWLAKEIAAKYFE